MARIAVPKPPQNAYNPDRKAGALLLAQLKHLEWAVRPASERGPAQFAVPANMTEAEVADRIAVLTAELHYRTIGKAPVIEPLLRAPRRSRPSTVRRRRRRTRTRGAR